MTSTPLYKKLARLARLERMAALSYYAADDNDNDNKIFSQSKYDGICRRCKIPIDYYNLADHAWHQSKCVYWYEYENKNT
jgi:hypothetical protein